MGRLFAIILYLAMIFAGVSSLQNMFEAVAESLLHKFPKLSRTAVLAILCVLCLASAFSWSPSASGARGWTLFPSILSPSAQRSARSRGST